MQWIDLFNLIIAMGMNSHGPESGQEYLKEVIPLIKEQGIKKFLELAAQGTSPTLRTQYEILSSGLNFTTKDKLAEIQTQVVTMLEGLQT